MKKIGVALSIPELEPYIKIYRDKYDKYKHIEPHMTIYLSDYKDYTNLEKLVKMLQTYTRKLVIHKIIHNKRITTLSIQNWKDFTDLRNTSTDVFGKEKYKSSFHITLGYKIPEEEFEIMKKDIEPQLPIHIEGSSYKIVLMKENEAKEIYIQPTKK